MVIAATLILTVLIFMAIVVPFFRNEDSSVRSWLFEFEDYPKATDPARTLLKQLESDYRTGILSEVDYRSQQNSLKGMASGALESKKEGVSLDDDIENRIAALRGGAKAAANDEIEEKVRQLRRTPTTAGSQPSAGGARQVKAARYCPQCGAKAQPGNRFCARCGEQLT